MTTKSAAPKSAAKKPAARKTAAPKAPAKKTAVRQAAPRKKPAPVDPQRARVDKIRAALDAKKGEAIAVLRIADVSSIADYLVLCTGLNNPHLRALADEVAKQLRLETPPVAAHRRAGGPESGWVVLDYLDVVVHLFTPQMRGYYALEQLWKDAPVVP
ncbi:MAG: ribosome silencing factor [Spartobacteria bacterium]|nr:ribosome silencing factor [Spartobacteria bacterium]